jgi:hypothetical protein
MSVSPRMKPTISGDQLRAHAVGQQHWHKRALAILHQFADRAFAGIGSKPLENVGI